MSKPFVADFALDTTAGDFENYTKRQIAKLEEAIFAEVDAINGTLAENLRWAYSGGVVQRRTGAAADSVLVNKAEMDEGYIIGSVQAGGDSAPEVEMLETGTAPHEIWAAAGSVLAFEWGGEMRFFTHVFSPGIRAYAIFEEVEKEVPKYEDALQAIPEIIF